MNTTVRRYPRSLAMAFPKDHSAAVEIHRPKESLGHRVVTWLSSALGVFLLIALANGY